MRDNIFLGGLALMILLACAASYLFVEERRLARGLEAQLARAGYHPPADMRGYAAGYAPSPRHAPDPSTAVSLSGVDFGARGDFTLALRYRAEAGAGFAIDLRDSARLLIGDLARVRSGWRGPVWIETNRQHRRGPDWQVRARPDIWHELKLELVGEHLWLWLNGTPLFAGISLDAAGAEGRPIAPHGGVRLVAEGAVEFADAEVADLSAGAVQQRLASFAPKGLERMFDGATLDGWTGALDAFAVEGGMLKAKSEPYGFLFYDKELSDYYARFEFRLPPGGNSGVALRYPGEGAPHLSGLELQLLDSAATQYASLDARQYHGAVYGFVAAHQGYLRAPGAWNLQEIQYVGSHIRVRLNGFTVLEADLSKVTSGLFNPLPPGLAQTKGQFGILSHGDAVDFRNLAVAPLPVPDAAPKPFAPDRSIRPETVIDLLADDSLSRFYAYSEKDGYRDPTGQYRFEQGQLHVRGDDFGGLVTRQSFTDYRMVFDYRWGGATWGRRFNRARDTGLLLHGFGPDHTHGPWIASVEAQIIEGGSGDILVLDGRDRWNGHYLPVSVRTTATEGVYDPAGETREWTRGRINWTGRSPDWQDEKGFRGPKDAERPVGEWNRMEVIARGNTLEIFLNGQRVNAADWMSVSAGRIGLQAELAEFWVKTWELHPLE